MIFCLKTALDDFRHISSRFYGIFVDFRDAFGSIRQDVLIKDLIAAGIPKRYCAIIADIYQDSHFEVICDGCLSKEIDLTIGVKTGDPSSALFFVVSLDRHLKAVLNSAVRNRIENPRRISPLPVRGYAEDVVFISHDYEIFADMILSFIINTGLNVRSDKCGIFYERRSGNRWYKSKSDTPPEVDFNGEKVAVLERHECYKYLGKPLSVAGESPDHLNEMSAKYCELLEKIVSIDLPIPVKIEALEIIAMSKISHHFFNTYISEEQLTSFDRELSRTLRTIFKICHSVTVRTFFQKKINGGLVIRKPSIVYRASRVSHLILMLNHADQNIRFVARYSFSLDMKKRNIPRSELYNNFLGYNVKENGNLDTRITGGFGTISDWPQLHRLLRMLRLKAQWEHPNSIDLMDAGKVILKYESGVNLPLNKNLRKKLQDIQLEIDEVILKGLKMQGKLFKLENADYLLSQDIFKNIKFADKLVCFWYKLRHNVVPCNFTLSKWYGIEPKCNLCQFIPESMAHLLNGCKRFSGLYSTRHDKLVNKFGEELSKFWEFLRINQQISTSFPELPLLSEHKHLKPDIVLKRDNTIYMVDVACPYDFYIQSAFNQKMDHYNGLCLSIRNMNYQCEVIPLVVGSCGIIHNRCLPYLIKLGLPKCQAKGLCKYSCNSNILFARSLWTRRCSLIFGQ